jgi:Ion channel
VVEREGEGVAGESTAGSGRSNEARRARRRRILEAFYSPDSYGLVVLLILFTYVLSVSIHKNWGASLVVVVQVATVSITLRASEAHLRIRRITFGFLVVAVLGAFVNVFFSERILWVGVTAAIGALLYLAASVSILRHLIHRRVVDVETVLGAIATYLMVGMAFAFLYRMLGAVGVQPFFGAQGDGTFPQDLFFSFTTLTTTGYGNLVPASNPGQTLAVAEMLMGQLFLVTAVAKVINAWQPGQGRRGLRSSDEPE